MNIFDGFSSGENVQLAYMVYHYYFDRPSKRNQSNGMANNRVPSQVF